MAKGYTDIKWYRNVRDYPGDICFIVLFYLHCKTISLNFIIRRWTVITMTMYNYKLPDLSSLNVPKEKINALNFYICLQEYVEPNWENAKIPYPQNILHTDYVLQKN